MLGFVSDAAAFLLRWLHVVAAIAWIGESFYFVMLDRGLKPPKQALPGLFGESWSVHGGGFYHKQKYLPAPAELPEDLHWSKWKAYTTWLSGFALLSLVYLTAPGVWLIDPRIMALTPAQAVLTALGLLAGFWLAYDLACRLVGFRDGLLGLVVGALVLALCLIATHVLAGRAAFLLVGAALATAMSANVFFVIIPGQKRMVAALQRGTAPDALDGARGKQRSVHNTYFTLPVVFAMLSTHYAAAWSHPHSGWVLALFLGGAAAIRQFFVLWHSGGRAWWLLGSGAAIVLAAFIWLAPRPNAVSTTAGAMPAPAAAEMPPVTTATVRAILAERCAACHAKPPQLLPAAPKGLVFDTDDEIETHAAQILQQTVALRIMPPGNLTGMTDAEREAIRRWFEAR